MPGVTELATEIIGTNVRLYVPTEMGLRNPTFAQVISIVDYVGSRSDIENLVTQAAAGNTLFSEPIVETSAIYREPATETFVDSSYSPSSDDAAYMTQTTQVSTPKQEKEPKESIVDKVRNVFGSMFD